MKADHLKESLREYAMQNHVDMVGFANISRFDNAPAEFHPHNIYPDVKTVVVLGIRILRGLMESLDNNMLIPYNAHGYGGINEHFMKDAKQRVACWLEDQGYSAIPVVQWSGTPQQEPIICHRTCAVAAGLGELGWSKNLLTKRFGPLQRLGIVLTNADLPSDPLQIGQICDGCRACVKHCPGQAIPKDEAVELVIDGQTLRHAKVDMFKCTIAHHGAVRETYPRPRDAFETSDLDKKYAKLREECQDDTDDYALGGRYRDEVLARYPTPIMGLVPMLGQSCAFCGARGCIRACLEHLEKRGLLDRSFTSPYVCTHDQVGRRAPEGTRDTLNFKGIGVE